MKHEPFEGNASIWIEETGEIVFQSLHTADISADVCVIGGGIAGLSTAYLLGREGQAAQHAGIPAEWTARAPMKNFDTILLR